ncbi:MAG TPA: hypothetical protein VFJ71_13940 [Candidatus Limnocylindrales bacterium]|nr:hypothetical protein [Candidatus Limnocylindrales bacterium]
MIRRLRGPLVLVPALAAVLAVAGYGVALAEPHGAAGSRIAFHDQMRKLWEDHITWTRMFIVSAATESGNLPDLAPTVDRLLANQVDLGNAIKPFYGDAAGNHLTALLREHILTAAGIVSAAKSGDDSAVATAKDAWYVNADEIAAFLSAANPREWPLDEMRSMMRSHLDLTLAEAVARLQGRYADDIVAYESVHAEILEMADMLSSGIVAQFPSRFTP